MYLLSGEEELLLEEALGGLVESALSGADRGLNLDVLRGEEADGRDIVARATSFPMVSERRVVVLRSPEKLSAHDLELVSNYCQEPSPSTCLILVSTKPDFRKQPFSTLRKTGNAYEFRRLYENQIPGWITERVRIGGRRIDPEGAKLLAAYVGTSLRELVSEIEKLFTYVGQRTEITEGDVSALVGSSKEYSPFELQKVIGRRETGSAVTMVEKMLDAGEAIPLIIASLTNYFLTLWKLHDLRRRGVSAKEQSALARINPYFMREYQDALNTQPVAACEEALLLLAEADEKTKSGGADPRQALLEMVIRLCGAQEGNISPPAGV
ncbi:MAG TPA: DNA polymerase III subunit delta [Bacteroidota bacterium]|nr:DNA polymerase III subunit delta [Bacteroidota bacterium]